MEAIQAQESEIASYLAHLSEVEFERIIGGEDDDYDGQEYTDAEARIRKGAATIEILHSALHADLPEWREAQLGLINLARRWEVAPPSLRRQEIVGVLKPGKQPLVIASYRTIALFHARARLVDELRMMRTEGPMAEFVGPAQQGGRSGSVDMLVAKVDAGRIRLRGLQLGVGIMPTDIENGFPTARRYLSLAGWKAAGMSDRDLRGVEEEENGTKARIRMGNNATQEFDIIEGLDQGRRRNPPGYSGLVKQLAVAVAASGPAMGLDPPKLVLEAAREAGVVAGSREPDLEEAEKAAATCAAILEISEGDGSETPGQSGLSEAEASTAVTAVMKKVRTDATRLAVLDMMSPTSVGMLQIIDDGCVFRSSPG